MATSKPTTDTPKPAPAPTAPAAQQVVGKPEKTVFTDFASI